MFIIIREALVVSIDLPILHIFPFQTFDLVLIETYLNFIPSTELSESSEHGIMALAALGLLHGDATLATAALTELSRHKHSCRFIFFLILYSVFSLYYIVRGLMVANVGFEFRDRNSIPIVYQITDARQVVCIDP